MGKDRQATALTPKMIEARAMLQGLKFVWVKGYCRVEIESDNSVLVTIIQTGLATNNNYSEVKLIQNWRLKNWEVKFRQILKESKRVANCLVKEAKSEMEQLIIHEEPPSSVGAY
ncbi:hypothetical protein CXB51_009610 [Gossypium anomalum]|uniref:RNase H type-1 domain-containing protein n=1 Tax=Gossypium anomalum TaxID=47600 RepID=A0A8J6CYJ3_9ROSI|nr:hypothetical protein CXB51_009610 [Gossypium anomalum]